MEGMDIPLFDKQMAFFMEEAITACWIGGRGCGKTFDLALWVVDQCMTYPGVRGVVASSSNPQLKQATIPDFKEVFDLVGIQYEYSEWNGVLSFGNGSSFKFQSFDVPEDRVKGGNIGFLAVDEIDACPEGHVKKLALAVRHLNGSRRRRYIGNSPPPGHWLERWFIPEVAKKYGKVVRGPLYRASMFDNYLLPQDYIDEALKDNPPGSVEYRRYIMGEMRVPKEGAVYSEFDDHHIVDYDDVPWDKVIGYANAIDLGNNHYTVFLRGALAEGDILYIFAEHAARVMLLKDHATRIHEKLLLDPAELGVTGTIYCDHDAQDAMELEALGILTVPAIKGAVVVGIDAVRERLRTNRLFFVRGCTPHLMYEMPYYVWDTKPKGRDMPVDKENDALDALRYIVTGLDVRRSDFADGIDYEPGDEQLWQ